MKWLLLPLISSLMLGRVRAQTDTVDKIESPHMTKDTAITISASTTGVSVFQGLIDVGFRNRLPLGIVVGQSPETQLCQAPLGLKAGEEKFSQLLEAVEAAAPGYRAVPRDGVLEVIPKTLPRDTDNLLTLRISHFVSGPDPLLLLGVDLWYQIENVIAPAKGRNTEALYSLDAETVSLMDLKDQSVEAILNRIVTKGSGGVWVLYASRLKELSPATPIPYEVRGYVGEGNSLNSILKCIG